jgi:hypothetical protein
MSDNTTLELPTLEDGTTAEMQIVHLLKQQITLQDQFSQLTKYTEACLKQIGQYKDDQARYMEMFGDVWKCVGKFEERFMKIERDMDIADDRVSTLKHSAHTMSNLAERLDTLEEHTNISSRLAHETHSR